MDITEEYKDYYATARIILGRYSDYITDEEIQHAFERGTPVEDFSNTEIQQLREHYN